MNVMQTRSYSINVEGGLDEAWSSWFGNMRIIQLPGTPTTTTLIGSVRDQPLIAPDALTLTAFAALVAAVALTAGAVVGTAWRRGPRADTLMGT
jgi:hypothetical protein